MIRDQGPIAVEMISTVLGGCAFFSGERVKSLYEIPPKSHSPEKLRTRCWTESSCSFPWLCSHSLPHAVHRHLSLQCMVSARKECQLPMSTVWLTESWNGTSGDTLRPLKAPVVRGARRDWRRGGEQGGGCFTFSRVFLSSNCAAQGCCLCISQCSNVSN